MIPQEHLHLHKYKRTILGGQRCETYIDKNGNKRKRIIKTGNGKPIYRCILPDCKHYVYRETLEGRVCQCWKCGERMVCTGESATLVKPRHWKCKKET